MHVGHLCQRVRSRALQLLTIGPLRELSIGGRSRIPLYRCHASAARSHHDRFDVVLAANGLGDFASEYAGARAILVDGLELRVLPLDRTLKSKRAGNRPKDQAQIPALEVALAVLRDQG